MREGVTRATHDLNRVTTLEITGWPGRYTIEARTDGSPGVELVAPTRVEGEFFTFARTDSQGTLRCHSNLLGNADAGLRAIKPDLPMVIKLPPSRVNDLKVVVKP